MDKLQRRTESTPVQGKSTTQPHSRSKRETEMEDSDLDKCCPTFRAFRLRNVTNNVYGQPRHIIHLYDMDPPMFQFIPIGICVSGNGECNDCIQEYRLQPLLVADFDVNPPRVIFDLFYIEAYCRCNQL